MPKQRDVPYKADEPIGMPIVIVTHKDRYVGLVHEWRGDWITIVKFRPLNPAEDMKAVWLHAYEQRETKDPEGLLLKFNDKHIVYFLFPDLGWGPHTD